MEEEIKKLCTELAEKYNEFTPLQEGLIRFGLTFAECYDKYGNVYDLVRKWTDILFELIKADKKIIDTEKKAENPINPEQFEREIEKTLDECTDEYNFVDWDTFARHFAQWGAEHSVSSEIPNDLEEAAKAAATEVYTYTFQGMDDLIGLFKAGAKWQADHTPLPEDTVLFNKGVEEGKRLMMEEAVEGRVISNDGISFPVSNEIHRLKLMEGDKVRIIVLPKENEHD